MSTLTNDNTKPQANLFTGLLHNAQVSVIRKACGNHAQSTGECDKTGLLCYYNAGTPQTGSIKFCPYVESLKEPLKHEFAIDFDKYCNDVVPQSMKAKFAGKTVTITITEKKGS